jgi:hypothetical protein
MAKRKNLFWNSAARVMDLILEDIGKPSIFKDVIGKAKRLCKFFYNHFFMLNLFRQQMRQRELKRHSVTRFVTYFLCLKSFEENKVCLKVMLGSKKWLESNFACSDERMSVMSIITKDDNF